ncbi:Glycoside hydrolase family 13 protein [Mycena venus]|uniref:alpha-amylase n=1 Tax=Mycena venus TaxID=2733690 RepID=A0A8H6XEA0_9AGAR|nr:Glycoside hydrolase family 13 protein [Mycena venus]
MAIAWWTPDNNNAKNWASKSIYQASRVSVTPFLHPRPQLTHLTQLVTDRFATSTDSSTACDTSKRTYCGGSWAGITNHLAYIQNMGFDAVWISPIVKNVDGTAYGDGYWSGDIDSLSSHFGTADDLKDLSAALHKRGMYFMLDVVVNHYAGIPLSSPSPSPSRFGLNPTIDIDFASLLPFGTAAEFHPQCFIKDYANQTEVEQCWLGDEDLPLPDVDTEDAKVVNTLYTWIEDMVKEYDVDGVRIDTVETDNATYAASYLGAVDGVLDYPTWYALIKAFASLRGNLSAFQDSPALASLAPASSAPPITAAFLENHDQPRFPSYTTDEALRKNAMVWPFVGDGIPTMYYGQEQGYEGGADPWNREALWLSAFETTKPGVATVKALNAVRKQAIAANASFLTTPARWIPQTNPSTIMLSKPPLLSLFTNIGSGANTTTSVVQPTWRVPPGLYAPGTSLVDVLACKAVVVDAGCGETVVQALGGMPQVLIPASMLSRDKGAGGACPALATGAGSRSAPGKSRVGRTLGVLGTVLGVGAML